MAFNGAGPLRIARSRPSWTPRAIALSQIPKKGRATRRGGLQESYVIRQLSDWKRMPKMMQRFAVRMAVALTTSLAAVVAGLVAASPAKADTWLRFVNERSGLCMGVSGGIMTPGRPIIQWSCNGNNDQYWGPYSSQTYTYLPLQ